MFLKVTTYDNGKPILFGLDCMRTPFSVALKAADVQFDANNKRLVYEGSFIVNVNGETRFLPRTRLKNAVVTNSPTITLKMPSYSFKVGDVIKAQAGFANLVFDGVPATGDVVTISINSVNYSSTATSGQDSAGKMFTKWLTDNNSALTTAGITITQRGVDSAVGTIVANDGHKIDTFTTGTSLGVRVVTTESGHLGASIVPLGTIASIGAANTAGERVITLSANAAYALPAETPVGVDVTKFLGIYNEQLDFTELPVEHLAPIYHADGVYENNLPYVDKQIKRVLHGLNINKKFYKAA